jgi:hypothetical protein
VPLRIILGQKYVSYEHALQVLSIQSLAERRKRLCIEFALKTRKKGKMKHMFPLNSNRTNVNTRKPEKYQVQNARTTRNEKSTIPYMQRLLNENHQQKKIEESRE